jgi:hypothetical protein
MFLQPALAFFVGVEIVENDVEFAIREGGNDTIHESEKLDTAPPLRMRGNDLPGGTFQRCKQGGGAVPFVDPMRARRTGVLLSRFRPHHQRMKPEQ